KIVEEPPEHLIFVFATTEPEKVLPTIRSRTHHYPFRLLAPRTMRSLLERICAQEDVTVDDAVYPLVIRAGGGSPRDTLSVLDQLLAGAEGNRVEYRRALALLGATDVALIDDAVDALAAGDAAALFGAVEAVMDAGHDPRRFATDLLDRFRDLIVLQSVPDAAARGVVDGPEDVLERMRDQATRVGTATLTRYAEVVHAGLGEMRGATAPRLLLEVVCARLLLPSASDTESALLQRVERIETRLDMSIPAGEAAASQLAAPPKQFARKSKAPEPAPEPPPAPKADPEPAPEVPPAAKAEPEPAPEPPPSPPPVQPPSDPVVEAPASTAAPVAGEPNAAAVRSMWTTVRDKVRQRSRTTEVMLAGAIVRAVDGDTLVLSHESAPLAKRLVEQRNSDVIRDALKDALGVDWKIRCDVGSAAAAPSVPESESVAPSPPQRDDDEEDMLAQAGNDASEAPRRDPEEAALELLQSELGARRIDGG
ncbi:MAG: polymerase subunit gamma/tau, partial [Mycobacterium sp.]|nr:polymerase subunit gamma/tau [Mycobacterium sp.]